MGFFLKTSNVQVAAVSSCHTLLYSFHSSTVISTDDYEHFLFLFPLIYKALTQGFINDTFTHFYVSLSFKWRDVWNYTHTHGRSLKRTSRQKYFVCQLQTCLLSLSFSPGKAQNMREQRQKLRGRREGGRGERERDRWTWRDRAKTRENENVRFDVIVCMSGFPIYSQFWLAGGEGGTLLFKSQNGKQSAQPPPRLHNPLDFLL